METMRKEMGFGIVGIGMAVAGAVCFLLSFLDVLEGMMYLMGFFLGVSLILCGLIVAGVYFWRYGRIRRLFRGDALLARWSEEDGEALITARNALVGGVLYEWAIPGTRLEEARLVSDGSGKTRYLELAVAEGRVSRGGPLPAENFWKTSRVRVRIPAGEEVAAERIAAEIGRFQKTE